MEKANAIHFVDQADEELAKHVGTIDAVLYKKYGVSISSAVTSQLLKALGTGLDFPDFMGITATRPKSYEITLNQQNELELKRFEGLLLGVFRLLKDALGQDTQRAFKALKNLVEMITADSPSATELLQRAIAKHHDDVEVLLDRQ